MVKPVDRVQINKQESTAAGGDTADNDALYLQLPLNSNEDAPEVQGLFIQDITGGQVKDENVYITRNGDNLIFRDISVGTEKTLSDLSGGSSSFTQIEIDFGISITRKKSFIISNALVSASSKIMAFQDGTAATGRQADENEMDSLHCVCIPGSTQFTLIVHGLEGPISGKYKISYMVG